MIEVVFRAARYGGSWSGVLVHAKGGLNTLYFFLFFADGSTNTDVFQPKTFCIPRGVIPQNFSSSDLVVLEELGNKTNRQNH